MRLNVASIILSWADVFVCSKKQLKNADTSNEITLFPVHHAHFYSVQNNY